MNSFLKRIQELNSDLIIREALLSDEIGFTKLMNRYYARKGNVKYFSWRFFLCPRLSVLYVVTTKENIIIGAYGMNIFTLSNGKKCGLTVDLIIDDEYKKRGLLFLLEDRIQYFAKRNKCEYLLCLPNAVGVKAHTKIANWQMIKTIPILVFDPHKVRRENFSSILSKKQTIDFEYDKSLLKWRFDQNPEYQYFHIQLDKCQSYLKIFFDKEKNVTYGDIVYYSFSNYSETTLRSLVISSVQKLQLLKAQKIITWCNEFSPIYSAFSSIGFVPKDQPRYLCIKALSDKAINPKLLNWQILPVDSEVF